MKVFFMWLWAFIGFSILVCILEYIPKQKGWLYSYMSAYSTFFISEVLLKLLKRFGYFVDWGSSTDTLAFTELVLYTLFITFYVLTFLLSYWSR
jgi:hypothetical protein